MKGWVAGGKVEQVLFSGHHGRAKVYSITEIHNIKSIDTPRAVQKAYKGYHRPLRTSTTTQIVLKAPIDP